MAFKSSYHILRVGLAITFIWIGVLILKNPESWAGYVQPWVVKLLPFSLTQTFIITAFFDIIVGVLLLIDWMTWVAALLAALHIGLVLTVSGITDITVRDIGLLAATLAILTESLPVSIKNKFSALKKKKVVT